jgi:hypothetical protein
MSMFHHGQIRSLAGVVGAGGIHQPLTIPIWQRRTYGLFRGRTLVALFVDEVGVESLDWEKVYGQGLTVFMLREWDVTGREDWREVVGELESKYQKEGARL